MKVDKRIPQWNNAIILEKKADGVLIVYSRSSGRLFEVHGLAAAACEAVDGTSDIATILADLSRDLDPSHGERLAEDLTDFLEELESRALIQFTAR